MLKAEDTVIKNVLEHWTLNFILHSQAEISFKAGFDEAQRGLYGDAVMVVTHEALATERTAGKKEVVESLRVLWTDGAITYLDSGTFKGKKLWAVPYELWQAKLKEWGLDAEKEES